MDNQHRKIAGYRELSQTEIDLMNKIKALGPVLEALCDKVDAHIQAQLQAANSDEERARLKAANPELWADWGRSGLQADLMYLTRSVAQPSFF